MRVLPSAKAIAAKGVLKLLRCYFIGKPMLMESSKTTVEGRVTGTRIADTDLILTWVPLGGTIRDARHVSAFSVRLAGKDWVFDA